MDSDIRDYYEAVITGLNARATRAEARLAALEREVIERCAQLEQSAGVVEAELEKLQPMIGLPASPPRRVM